MLTTPPGTLTGFGIQRSKSIIIRSRCDLSATVIMIIQLSLLANHRQSLKQMCSLTRCAQCHWCSFDDHGRRCKSVLHTCSSTHHRHRFNLFISIISSPIATSIDEVVGSFALLRLELFPWPYQSRLTEMHVSGFGLLVYC